MKNSLKRAETNLRNEDIHININILINMYGYVRLSESSE